MNLIKQISPHKLQERVGAREIFIWGARHDGYATNSVLQRYNLKVTAFIDSSLSIQGTEVMGLPVQAPVPFFKQHSSDSAFIVIASGFYADEIGEECHQHSFTSQKDYIAYKDLTIFSYQIDVSGFCNLRCISCPRGNMNEHRDGGYMSASTYQKVLDKILTEDPYTGIITLYNWGEPLLNKELSEIISINNRASVLSAISSNLNIRKDFVDVIKAKPTWLRVSTSGWGKNYELTHTGGQWDLFYKNLYLLKEHKERYHPELIVEVFYHIYAHNRDDYKKYEILCDELGFTLRHRHAALAPLDNIAACIEGREMSPEAIKTRELQVLKVSEAMTLAREQINRPCYYERHLWIDWNLQIAQCMEWYAPELNLVDEDFLSVSANDLLKAREESEFCVKCKERAIHRCYCVYGDEKLIQKD